MTGIPNGQKGMYLRVVSDRERRPTTGSLEIMVDVPKVNGVISPSSCKRKGLNHGANCGQSLGFPRYGRLFTGSNWASLGGADVSWQERVRAEN